MVRPPVADNICIRCKGSRLLCGKSQCPILMKHSILKSSIPPEIKRIKNGESLFGASPPAVFVGHVGYPRVNIGPMLPIGEYAELKDTSFLDAPETWYGKTMDEIIKYRSTILRSNFRMKVMYNENIEETFNRAKIGESRLLEATQELTMASNSVDTEAKYSRVNMRMQYDNHSQPQGPVGQAEDIKVIDNVKVARSVDKVVSDTDQKAASAITDLFNADEASLTSMQRIFSTGLLGTKKRRKLVPTRWTITAIDDIIGKHIKKQIQHNREIDKYITIYGEYLDNKFLILLMPGQFCFEMNECWNAQSIWNRSMMEIDGMELEMQIQNEIKEQAQNPYIKHYQRDELFQPPPPAIMNDYETEKGRKKYASNVTGAYYAARKEVEEYLYNNKRQAQVVVFREVSGGYVVPLGVWVIRQTIRNALEQAQKGHNIEIHQTLNQALGKLDAYFSIDRKYWIKNSHLLKYLKTQRKITEWFN